MRNRGRIGAVAVVYRSTRELCLHWRIPGFLNLPHVGRYDYYESSRFSFFDACWFMTLCPNRKNSGQVELSLRRDDSGIPKTVNIAFGIWGSCGVAKRAGGEVEFRNNDEWSFEDFCMISELREQEQRLMPDGALTIQCEMKFPGAARGIEHKVLEDMGKLLASGNKSDVTVQVQEAEFRVHSNILCARSPIFSAMLEHDTAERASHRINIEHCRPEVFEEYLRYLYTGSVKSLSPQTVFGLYRVADKYLADDLKRLCLEYIRDMLCVQTCCDTVTLALTHRESNLLQRVVDFATQNRPLIIGSEEWQNFICEHPIEASEILSQMHQATKFSTQEANEVQNSKQ